MQFYNLFASKVSVQALNLAVSSPPDRDPESMTRWRPHVLNARCKPSSNTATAHLTAVRLSDCIYNGVQPDVHGCYLGPAVSSMRCCLLRWLLHALLAAGNADGQARVFWHLPPLLLPGKRRGEADHGDAGAVRPLRILPRHPEPTLEDLHSGDGRGVWPPTAGGPYSSDGLLHLGPHLSYNWSCGWWNPVCWRWVKKCWFPLVPTVKLNSAIPVWSLGRGRVIFRKRLVSF